MSRSQGRYAEAESVFDSSKDMDPRALYQLAVMYYDGLGRQPDHVSQDVLFCFCGTDEVLQIGHVPSSINDNTQQRPKGVVMNLLN